MGATVYYNMSNHIWKHSLKGKNGLFTILMNLTLFDIFKVIFDMTPFILQYSLKSFCYFFENSSPAFWKDTSKLFFRCWMHFVPRPTPLKYFWALDSGKSPWLVPLCGFLYSFDSDHCQVERRSCCQPMVYRQYCVVSQNLTSQHLQFLTFWQNTQHCWLKSTVLYKQP